MLQKILDELYIRINGKVNDLADAKLKLKDY